MSSQAVASGLEMRSEITSSGDVRLTLVQADVPVPGAGEIVIQVEAAPINPSDLGLMFGPVDAASLRPIQVSGLPAITAAVNPAALPSLSLRIDKQIAVGNEGAGTVVIAGEGAEHLMGKRVAAFAGGMYAEYRLLKASDCIVLPEDATSAEGAAAFVNPLTALGMVETMRREGHKGIVHTTAASNLGQMLNRLCIADGIPLVNIVRSPEQAEMLRSAGAVHVCDSSAPRFKDDLVSAIADTGATIAFDATWGGTLSAQILDAMELVARRELMEYNLYGSARHKQVYVYGILEPRPLQLEASRNVGFAWGISGWLLPHFLEKIGQETAQRLRERVADNLRTIFASHFTAEVSLEDALAPEVVASYLRRATGQKYLISPARSKV